MHRCYAQFDTPMFDEWLMDGRRQRNALATQRRDLVADISERVSPMAANEIMAVANKITTLNQLNLALEPCFSFKGGPGVPHGLIFMAAADSGLGAQLAHDQLQKEKWELFFSTTV